MTPSEHRTAVLLDQHPLWLDAVENVLHRIGVEVKGKATSPHHAIALVEEHRPSLLVTAVEMDGDVDGIECLALARERVPGLKVIVLSAYSDGEYVDGALAAGADAYVVKTAHADDLASAIRQAFDHSIYLARSHNGRHERRRESVEESWGLTRRELEILTLVAEGHSNAQLARMLWVTEQTVKFHLSNIYRKLNVANRTEASRWAQVHGLLPLQTAPQGTAA
ncbi:MAG TPA: response regulator transcription factor [Gaiellaceae bacterium]|nr:response regulator transcription factor [Gaiellaceae bacterium]